MNGGICCVVGFVFIIEFDFVENVDVMEFVKGYMEYCKVMLLLLLKCGWFVESEEFMEIEELDLENYGEC